MLAQLLNEYPDDVRLIYRHFPLVTIHDKALLSAQAAEAAGLQGKFFEMHDLLFEKQGSWATLTVDQFKPWLKDAAASLGLDADQFMADLESDATFLKVKQSYDDARAVGLSGTPFLLINNNISQGPYDYNNLKWVIELYKLEKRQVTGCPPMVIDPAKQYIATLKTAKGDVVLQLFPDKAPVTVNSFVTLARQGWFDNITFHRVIENFVAQTGDPSGTGFGSPGYYFIDEISDLKFDKEGVVAMANSGKDTNGSQFFITFGPIPNLDGKYTIFGQVLKGMDVLRSLTLRDPSKSASLPPGDPLISVTIEEK